MICRHRLTAPRREAGQAAELPSAEVSLFVWILPLFCESSFDSPVIRVPFPTVQIGSAKQRQSLVGLLRIGHRRSHQADQRDDGPNGKTTKRHTEHPKTGGQCWGVEIEKGRDSIRKRIAQIENAPITDVGNSTGNAVKDSSKRYRHDVPLHRSLLRRSVFHILGLLLKAIE